MKQLIKKIQELGYVIEVKSDNRFKCFLNLNKTDFLEIIKSDGFFILQICSGVVIEGVWFRSNEKEIYDLIIDLELGSVI